ncbi:MAG: hypothetical protein KatS3mg013_0920 [Actinomycetota bacterium]|nr:MAG: hypothetical protein KatS3mg013_0920 [Actinomycetota bacterium]
MSEPRGEDPARTELARHLYWADDPGRRRAGTAALREDLLEFAAKLRTDERLLIPLGEPYLDAPSPLKRRVKYLVFRLLRPVTRRYDRLLAEQTDLTVRLAERVGELEREVARLREGPEEAGR